MSLGLHSLTWSLVSLWHTILTRILTGGTPINWVPFLTFTRASCWPSLHTPPRKQNKHQQKKQLKLVTPCKFNSSPFTPNSYLAVKGSVVQAFFCGLNFGGVNGFQFSMKRMKIYNLSPEFQRSHSKSSLSLSIISECMYFRGISLINSNSKRAFQNSRETSPTKTKPFEMISLHPGRFTWTLQITHIGRKMIF